MLSGVAVRGRIWHAAHALARDKSVLSSLWGKNQVDYYGEPRNFGHLKRVGQKKMVHIFVYQWEVQGIYIPAPWILWKIRRISVRGGWGRRPAHEAGESSEIGDYPLVN